MINGKEFQHTTHSIYFIKIHKKTKNIQNVNRSINEKKYIISLKNRHFISCSHFELEKFEKGPKEIFDPDIQKDILVLEEQEVTKRIMQILLSLLIN